MYFGRKCKITFICNGATIYSEDDRFTDSESYPPLSDDGVEEIYLLSVAKLSGKILYTTASSTQEGISILSEQRL